MTTRKELAPVFEAALVIVDQREVTYGPSWQKDGSVCLSEVFRKASDLRAQCVRGQQDTESFAEDLLDLINWAGFSYWHNRRRHETSTRV